MKYLTINLVELLNFTHKCTFFRNPDEEIFRDHGRDVNSGLLYLEKLIDTLGNPRAKADHHREQIASGSLLTEKLKNALGGTALTLLICCVSQSIKEADRTFYTLKFASKASNICNYPSQNVTLLFQDLDEEISFINQSKPTMPTMPDLINPFIMQPQMMQPQIMQQQMLHQMVNNYLLMFQQQQQHGVTIPSFPLHSQN